MTATASQIANSIGKDRMDGGGSFIFCNNCSASINVRGPVHSCAVCLNGETPSLRDLLCGKCRERHRKGHGE